MLIEQPAIWLRWLYPHALWRMDKRDRAIYLTFDDGPIPEATPFVLDTLSHYGVKATFFMVGDNVRKHPELFQRVLSEGHMVGNHTLNHISSGKHGQKTYGENVEKANRLIHSHLFRPPHGWMRMPQYWKLRRKYTIVMWDLVTRDYSKWMTSDDVLNNVKRYARPGSIITFHDSLRSIDKLRSALPRSIEWLKDQGYEFRLLE